MNQFSAVPLNTFLTVTLTLICQQDGLSTGSNLANSGSLHLERWPCKIVGIPLGEGRGWREWFPPKGQTWKWLSALLLILGRCSLSRWLEWAHNAVYLLQTFFWVFNTGSRCEGRSMEGVYGGWATAFESHWGRSSSRLLNKSWANLKSFCIKMFRKLDVTA